MHLRRQLFDNLGAVGWELDEESANACLRAQGIEVTTFGLTPAPYLNSTLIEALGTGVDNIVDRPALRDDVIARYKKLQIPIYFSGIFATLTPVNGVVPMSVSDVDGVKIAGLLFDAGGSAELDPLGPGFRNAAITFRTRWLTADSSTL